MTLGSLSQPWTQYQASPLLPWEPSPSWGKPWTLTGG